MMTIDNDDVDNNNNNNCNLKFFVIAYLHEMFNYQ